MTAGERWLVVGGAGYALSRASLSAVSGVFRAGLRTSAFPAAAATPPRCIAI